MTEESRRFWDKFNRAWYRTIGEPNPITYGEVHCRACGERSPNENLEALRSQAYRNTWEELAIRIRNDASNLLETALKLGKPSAQLLAFIRSMERARQSLLQNTLYVEAVDDPSLAEDLMDSDVRFRRVYELARSPSEPLLDNALRDLASFSDALREADRDLLEQETALTRQEREGLHGDYQDFANGRRDGLFFGPTDLEDPELGWQRCEFRAGNQIGVCSDYWLLEGKLALSARGRFVEGKAEGVHVDYNPHFGTVHSCTSWKNGVPSGPFSGWSCHPGGVLGSGSNRYLTSHYGSNYFCIGSMHDGKHHGVWREWWEISDRAYYREVPYEQGEPTADPDYATIGKSEVPRAASGCK